ncbi:MAG TPA: methyltransferase domain-containing protein [Gallionellaceae bacterium]|nr:methyltransferase domain-containing protein [Gallionellaceae bacterium]
MKVHNTLSEWLETPHGRYLLEREQDLFDRGVSDIFGYNALQLGLCDHELLRAARIPLRVLAGYGAAAQVLTRPDELPFDSGSLDLVLLPHVLEFAEHPHHITREVERIMMPGGHLLLTGFNPRSLWGLRRWLGRKNGYPWCGKFISLPRIRDWLELLGFEVVEGRFACYAPPLGRTGWLNRMRFLEPAGDRWWAMWGGVYFLHAVKRVPGVRPIKPLWNGRLVGNLLPVRPKLNRNASHHTDTTDTQ